MSVGALSSTATLFAVGKNTHKHKAQRVLQCSIHTGSGAIAAIHIRRKGVGLRPPHPRSKLTLTFNAEGLVTHEQPVGLRPRQPVGLRPRHFITLCSLRGLVLPSRELFNYVDNVVLEVGSISQ